jgi:hypothetical protein
VPYHQHGLNHIIHFFPLSRDPVCPLTSSPFSVRHSMALPMEGQISASSLACRDACITVAIDFYAALGNSMLGMTLTGVAIDGADNPWFVLIDGAIASSSTDPGVMVVAYLNGTLTK